MDLDQLKAMGLVSANPIVKREITIRYRPLLPAEQWKDPGTPERQEDEVEGTVTVWLRKLTGADQIKLASASQDGRDLYPLLIHLSVFDERGARVFPTPEDAAGLDAVMFASLLVEIDELNADIRKKSHPRTRYGASSRSPSGDAASPNGSSASLQRSSPSGNSIARSGDR